MAEAARDAQLTEMKSGHGDEDYSCIVRQYFPDGVPSERKVAAESIEETPDLPLETAAEPVKPVEPDKPVEFEKPIEREKPIEPEKSSEPPTEPTPVLVEAESVAVETKVAPARKKAKRKLTRALDFCGVYSVAAPITKAIGFRHG